MICVHWDTNSDPTPNIFIQMAVLARVPYVGLHVAVVAQAVLVLIYMPVGCS